MKNMDIETHKNNLKKYIEEDMSFKEPLKNISDFDKYCYNHCLDIKEVLAELDKKDKIINEMTEYISKLDIDDEICSKNTINPEYCNEDYTNCKKCIIEYFTKKAEGK